VVLNAIKGYQIPFASPPPVRSFLAEPNFSTLEATHCDNEVDRLLQKGAINIVDYTPDQFLSPFFLREKSSGGDAFHS